MRTTSRRIASLIAALTFMLLIAACSAGSPTFRAPQPAEGGGGGVGVAEPGVIPEDDSGSGGGEDSDGGDNGYSPVAPAELQIIKTGDVSIRVGDVFEGVGAVRALATEMGGYVGSSQTHDSRSGATLTLRIPAARFEDTLERLRSLGDEVLNEVTREEDVTSAVVDLDARITNLRASEETYRTLLSRTERIEDILAVQTRLDEVRGQIEQLEAEAAYLEEQAELSTLSVTLVPPALETSTEGWNPGQAVNLAVAALVTVGQTLLVVLIWVGIVFVPILLVIGVITFVVMRVVERFRRRETRQPVA